MKTATKKQATIAQAVIYKVTIKATGKSFYAIKSDSSNEMYQLHMNADGEYKCSCASRKPCKHLRALNEILDIQTAELFSCDEYDVVAEAASIVAALETSYNVLDEAVLVAAGTAPTYCDSCGKLSRSGRCYPCSN